MTLLPRLALAGGAAFASLGLWSMADHPQRYEAAWYAAGGLRRTVQVLATDVLGPRGVLLLLALALGLLFVRPGPLVLHGRRLRERLRGVSRRVAFAGLLLLAALLVAALVVPARSRSGQGSTTSGRAPSILLVSVASLRIARAGAPHMPALARLAARGTSFDRAYASIARPEPAWSVLLSGSDRQPADRETLPSRLARAGYATAAVSDADPAAAARSAIATLRGTQGRPFFLSVSFAATRPPYAVAAPYYAKYTDPAYRGRFKYQRPPPHEGEAPLDAADLRHIDALYDGAVSAVDDALGDVLRALDDQGLAESTIVVVTGDHDGDSLLGDEGTHIPLVIRDPRLTNPPAHAVAVVRDVDLAPTLGELAGVPADGRSLAPLLRGEPAEPLPAFAETEPRGDAELPGARMVRGERFKLVYLPSRTGVSYRLFDTAADPAEQQDVAARHPEVAAQLRADLWAWMLRGARWKEQNGFLVPRGSGRSATVLAVVVDALAPGSDAFDALAKEGVRFSNAYASGAPLLPLRLPGPNAPPQAFTSAREASAWMAGHPDAPFIVVATAARGDASGHVPLVVVAPGLLPAGRVVDARISTLDLAPTVAELLGLEADTRSRGRSLLALALGETEPDERVVVTEGPAGRAILHGRHRLLVHEAAGRTTKSELFDLLDDPEQRRDLAAARPEVASELQARLVAALAEEPVAGSRAATAPPPKLPVVHVRFAGGGAARRISGTLRAGDASAKVRSLTVEPVELGRDSVKTTGERAELAFLTSPSAVVGFDVVVDPPLSPITWELYLEDRPWPEGAVFGGPYSLVTPILRAGVTSDDARLAAEATLVPQIDPQRELGLFVVRERVLRAAPTR